MVLHRLLPVGPLDLHLGGLDRYLEEVIVRRVGDHYERGFESAWIWIQWA